MMRTNHLKEQINGLSSPTRGLTKRPPWNYLATLSGAPTSARIHCIERDTEERYVVFITTSGIQVWDYNNSVWKTVTYGTGALAYLSSITDLHQQMDDCTDAYYTFITNRNTVTAMNPSQVSPAPVNEALVYLRSCNYGRTYAITINGTVVASYRTPASGTNAAAYVDTAVVLSVLSDAMAGNSVSGYAGGPASTGNASGTGTITTANGWTVTAVNGTCLHFQNNTPFTISVADGDGNTNLICAQGSIQDFANLPMYGYPNQVLEVSGANSSNVYAAYYVKFQAEGSPTPYSTATPNGSGSTWEYISCTGSWEECEAPSLQIGFDATTMPHALIRQSDGTFLFTALTWTQRLVGDNNTNPIPSFIGQPIQSVDFYRNRMCLLSGENIIMSASGNYFNFFATTAQAVLDSDPIDVAQNGNKVANLYWQCSFQNVLVLYGDLNQFTVIQDQLLSPKNISIFPSTEYDVDVRFKPFVCGDSMFFVGNRTQHLGLYEQRALDNFQLAPADEVTAQCPTYLPITCSRFVASHANGMIFGFDPVSNNVYPYVYQREQATLIQSAWSTWQLSGIQILDIGIMFRDLIVVGVVNGNVVIGTVHLDVDYEDVLGIGYQVLLDQKISDTGLAKSFSALTDSTTYTLPFTMTDTGWGACVRYVNGMEATPAGSWLQVTAQSGSTITLQGNTTGLPIWFGRAYTMDATLPEFFNRDMRYQDKPILPTTGRLQIQRIGVQFDRTAFFTIQVSKVGSGNLFEATNALFTGEAGPDLGNADFNPQAVALYRGEWSFPVNSKSDRVTIQLLSSSHLPCQIVELWWAGKFTPRATRI